MAALASHLFGTGPQRVKYASSSKLSKALLPLASQPFAASAFNFNYSDTGLFGFHLVADQNDVGKVAIFISHLSSLLF